MCTVFVLQANKHKDILVYSYAMGLPTVSPLPDPYFMQVWTSAPDVWDTDRRSNTLPTSNYTYHWLCCWLLCPFLEVFQSLALLLGTMIWYKSFPFNILTFHRMVCHRELCLASTNPLCHTSDLQWCVASPSNTLCKAHKLNVQSSNTW